MFEMDVSIIINSSLCFDYGGLLEYEWTIANCLKPKLGQAVPNKKLIEISDRTTSKLFEKY